MFQNLYENDGIAWFELSATWPEYITTLPMVSFPTATVTVGLQVTIIFINN